jgi:type IV pilus assembly protein PilC
MATKANEGVIDFIWEGKDQKGEKNRGEITALTEAAARSELRKMGVRVLKVKPKPKPLFQKAAQPITTQDISVFARQIATMMQAGVPLVQSFDIIGKGHDNVSMGDMIMAIKADIEEGDTFAEALRKRPLYFDDLFCNLVAAGEQAGILETLLGKVAAYKEKSESMRKKVKKALTYPIAVLVVAFIVTAILLIFVVPVFDSMFKSFGKELPAFTQMVVKMSAWMQEDWWKVVGGVFAMVKIWGFVFVRSAEFRHAIDKALLQAPIFGQIIYKSALARFARTLGTMSAAGVPLVEALVSVAGACGNIIFYEAVMRMQVDISSGQRLQFAMEQAKMGSGGLFPNMMMQMVAIGEESGKVDSMLEKVADFYDEEVDNLVDNMSALMEPFIMVVLGTLIGGLIVAMYLPIFAMGEAVG